MVAEIKYSMLQLNEKTIYLSFPHNRIYWKLQEYVYVHMAQFLGKIQFQEAN